MSKLSIEEKEELMRALAVKHPVFATLNNMIEGAFPAGLTGMLQIQEDIEEFKSFEGTDEEFTELLKNKRKAFRQKNDIEDIDISDEDVEKFTNAAKLVKIITKK